MDENNRLLLDTECHNKQDNLEYCFIFSNLFIMFHLKAYIHTLEATSHLTFRGPCIVIYSYIKVNKFLFISFYFDKKLYMFRTDFLFIIRILKNQFTTTGICNIASCFFCIFCYTILLRWFYTIFLLCFYIDMSFCLLGFDEFDKYQFLWSIKTPDEGQ